MRGEGGGGGEEQTVFFNHYAALLGLKNGLANRPGGFIPLLFFPATRAHRERLAVAYVKRHSHEILSDLMSQANVLIF